MKVRATEAAVRGSLLMAAAISLVMAAAGPASARSPDAVDASEQTRSLIGSYLAAAEARCEDAPWKWSIKAYERRHDHQEEERGAKERTRPAQVAFVHA